MSSDEHSQKGIIAWFINNPVASNLLMLMIIVVGVFSFKDIGKSLTPEYQVSAVRISVLYPGAGPAEVERGVVLKIEEAIQEKNIRGIKKMNSISRESLAQVTLEIDEDVDIGAIASEIKLAVDGVDTFPEETEKPAIEKLEQSIPALNIQIYGPGLNEQLAKKLVNQVKDDLLAIPGISKIVLYGERESEIAVEVSEQQLRKYGLTLRQIANAIDAASVDLPAGSIKSEKGDLLLRAKGRAYVKSDFEKIPLRTSIDGQRLLLGDIATIKETFEEGLNSNNFDGLYSTGVGVFSVGDEDIVKAATAAKDYIEEMQKKLPNGVSITYWGETVKYLEGRLELMYENLLIGALLVLIVLSLFMNLSIAFWVMLGIPVCFLGALIFMPSAGVTLNLISLFGFILVLGIVVDDAIIIGESAHTYIRRNNNYDVSTILEGVHRVSTPAVFGVLTTICAFLPTIFIDGKWGNFPAACGYVVIFCLIFSLVESKLILPSHIAHGGGFSKLLNFKWQSNLQKNVNDKLEKFVQNSYQPFLEVVLKNRYISISLFIAVLILVIGLLAGGWVRYVLAPEVPSDYLRSSLTMPHGTSDDQVQKNARYIENALLNIEKRYMQETGNSNFIKHRFTYNIDVSNRTTVELVDNKHRSISSAKILDDWEKEVGSIIGAKSLVFTDAQDENVGVSSDIAYNISGKNEKELYTAARELKQQMQSYSGVTSVEDGVPESIDEIQFSLKPGGQALGLTLASVASQVREAFYGAEARRLQRDNDEVKIKVRYPEAERKTINNLNELYVRAPDGRGVPVNSVAELHVESSMIERVRLNGKQALTVAAQIDKSFAEPKKISAELEGVYLPQLEKKFPSIRTEQSGGSEDDAKMERQLFFGFMLSLLGIYVLLAIPLASYSQPIMIMSVIPFGIIGAIFGHMVMGLAVSMMSIFGIIALSGVVVNDSLIMVDFINTARKEGKSIVDAVVSSGGERFRAILLTSLTTFFGILPILLETSVQAQFIIPMAVSLGFGIIFATVITLILIPCLYLLLDDFKSAIGSLFGSKKNSDINKSVDNEYEGRHEPTL